MKLLRDPLGRPIKRLYFKTEELDERCERIVAEFMDHRSGGFRLPIPTDDIIRMIEAEADDLDLYADLPESVDGYTDFFADRNPTVKISERLSSPRFENRLRMTLGHEYRPREVSRSTVEKIRARVGPPSRCAIMDVANERPS